MTTFSIRRLAGFLFIAISLFIGTACAPILSGPQLDNFDTLAPQPGAKAPDFTLYDLSGGEQELAEWFGDKPVVVQFGSHTSPTYRNRRRGMQRLYQKYRDQVRFVLIYTLEAHPYRSPSPYKDDGKPWVTVRNQVPAILLPQHNSLQERMMVASMSKTELQLDYPYLVDNLENTTWNAYGAAPSPAFVIDRNGLIALRQASVDPGAIDKTLAQLLLAP